VVGTSPALLKSELNSWLDLHLTHEVPGALLVLSRAFLLTDSPQRIPSTVEEGIKRSAEALQNALEALPDQVVCR
jgi:LETM1 and EF-hand domain-containing protein 1, mitochondrial